MISPDQIIFLSDSAQSNPASSVTFVGPITPHSRPRTVVEIEKMSSDLLELVDQYDAIARELRRKDIPLKISWETNRNNETARLEKMAAVHDCARTEQLSLDLGESNDSKLTAARISRLNTEVDSDSDPVHAPLRRGRPRARAAPPFRV